MVTDAWSIFLSAGLQNHRSGPPGPHWSAKREYRFGFALELSSQFREVFVEQLDQVKPVKHQCRS